VPMPVTPVAPSIFSMDYTGSGQGAILNQDGVTVNATAAPAPKGSIVSIYATGEGQTNPSGIDGQFATSFTLPKPKLPVTVTIGGRPAEVLYYGAAPGQVAGLMQVNARIPADVDAGEVPVTIQVGTAASQPGITVVVK
jgi:trimeric autotransporter adhesin